MKVNYDNLMQEQIKKLQGRAKLLLHSCCAPCSSAVIERLKEHFDITVYYYNPNIDDREEFVLRAKEQERLCKELGVGYYCPNYNEQEFYEKVQGLEKEKEGGARCVNCFLLRLESTAKYASDNGYEYFATTLTVSPLKNAQIINETGEKLQDGYDIKYLFSDFKKKGGYLRSIELSKQYDLYRQNYCGCSYSKKVSD